MLYTFDEETQIKRNFLSHAHYYSHLILIHLFDFIRISVKKYLKNLMNLILGIKFKAIDLFLMNIRFMIHN